MASLLPSQIGIITSQARTIPPRVFTRNAGHVAVAFNTERLDLFESLLRENDIRRLKLTLVSLSQFLSGYQGRPHNSCPVAFSDRDAEHLLSASQARARNLVRLLLEVPVCSSETYLWHTD